MTQQVGEENGQTYKRMKDENLRVQLEYYLNTKGFVTLPIALLWNVVQRLNEQAAEVERLKDAQESKD